LIALYSALAVVIVFTIRLILDIFVFKIATVGQVLGRIAGLINIVVVLIVVSIPDGLPITIGISLAFSVKKMFNQKILVRDLGAPEKMAGIQEICCGKTATLTKNEMKVVQFVCEDRLIVNNRKDTLLQCDLQTDTLIRIQESILYNCDARVEMAESVY
jgi:P-type E1-E2 ATPase